MKLKEKGGLGREKPFLGLSLQKIYE